MNDPYRLPLEKSAPLPAPIGRVIVDVICAVLVIYFMVKAFSLADALVKLHIALVAP